MTASSTLTISTALLVAVAKWTSEDSMRPHLGCVVIREGEMYATDGHRLVRVPIGDKSFSAAISRQHILAAAAAQRELSSGHIERDEDRRPAIKIAVDGMKATLDIGQVSMVVRQVDMAPHARSVLDGLEPKCSPTKIPDGYIFNPKLLIAIGEVHDAADNGRGERGVKLAKWGSLDHRGDLLEPVVFTGDLGIRFVVMPMRDTHGGGS